MSIMEIQLVCTHGIEDGTADFVDRFKLVPSLGGPKWVPIRGHSRIQQLHGDELQVYPLAGEPDDGELPIRDRYQGKCDRCRRTLPLRDEKLQALLSLAASQGHDTLRLDRLL